MDNANPKTSDSTDQTVPAAAAIPGNTTTETAPATEPASSDGEQPADSTPSQTDKESSPKRRLLKIHPNVYIAAFILFIITSVGIIMFAVSSNRNNSSTIGTVELSPEALDSLSSQQTAIDSQGQLLTIAPDTEFNGRVTVKDTVEVIGDLVVSGTITTPGDNDGGSQLQNADIPGDLSVQGNLGVQNIIASGNLNLGGDASVAGDLIAGSITTQQLNLPNGFIFTNHLVSGAGSVGANSGNAVGGGGTTSVSGNDIAGTLNINTGSGPSAGALITVQFRTTYGKPPSVQLTPLTSAAARTDYYVTRTSSGFTVHAASTPPGGSALHFQYFVIE